MALTVFKVSYIGWLGERNLGDLVLRSAIQQLYPDWHFEEFDSEWRDCDLVMLGGGTLIPWEEYLEKLEIAQSKGVPTVVFGTSGCDLRFWETHRPEMGKESLWKRWQIVFGRCEWIFLRNLDFDRAGDLCGGRAEEIGDPALAGSVPDITPPRGSLLGLNLGSHDPVWGSQECLLDSVCHLVNRLLSDGASIELLALHELDRYWAQRISSRFPAAALPIVRPPSEIGMATQFFSRYRLVIGQRLHAAVLASAAQTAVISLAYNPKCVSFMRQMGLEAFCVRTDTADSDRLYGLVLRALAERESIQNTLVERNGVFRQRQLSAAARIRESYPA